MTAIIDGVFDTISAFINLGVTGSGASAELIQVGLGSIAGA
ncbi:hypothetical protein [Rhodococcus sp. KBS0724]|nr:hypothetical protein [Rhodococcus sp. KBS0724]